MWQYKAQDDNDFLVHYGIKGQKKGVRRWTDKNGELTEAGKRRYGYDMTNDSGSSRNTMQNIANGVGRFATNTAKNAVKTGTRALQRIGVVDYGGRDRQLQGSARNKNYEVYSNGNRVHDRFGNSIAKPGRSVEEMQKLDDGNGKTYDARKSSFGKAQADYERLKKNGTRGDTHVGSTTTNGSGRYFQDPNNLVPSKDLRGKGPTHTKADDERIAKEKQYASTNPNHKMSAAEGRAADDGFRRHGNGEQYTTDEYTSIYKHPSAGRYTDGNAVKDIDEKITDAQTNRERREKNEEAKKRSKMNVAERAAYDASKAANKVGEVGKTLYDNAKHDVEYRAKDLAAGAAKVHNDVQDWVTDAVDKAGDWVSDTAKKAKDWTSKAASDIGDWTGKAIIDAKDWTDNAIKNVGDFATDTYKGASAKTRMFLSEVGLYDYGGRDRELHGTKKNKNFEVYDNGNRVHDRFGSSVSKSGRSAEDMKNLDDGFSVHDSKTRAQQRRKAKIKDAVRNDQYQTEIRGEDIPWNGASKTTTSTSVGNGTKYIGPDRVREAKVLRNLEDREDWVMPKKSRRNKRKTR